MLLSQQAAEVYQLTAWNLAKGKGIDDLLVGEARADLTREKILENLVKNAVPFVDTITKTKVDLDAVQHELIKVHLDPIFRVRLCKELARKCDVPVDLLRRLGGEETKETATILGFNEVLEPWPGPVNGAELLHDLAAIIKRHIVLDNDSAAAVALWIVLTYVSHVVDTLPILAITSPEKRCGKSRLLSVLLRLVYQPMACVDITPAALFRSIEKWHPTLLVDEADTFLKENVELRGIFNSGHTRDQAWVPRCVGDEMDVQMFSTWAPKSIAQIGELPSTLRDRSIQISMKRRARGEVVVPLRKTPKTEFDILRRKILRWVLDKTQLIETIEPSLPDTLNDRAADNWLPLMAIAVAAGEDWPEIARSALINLSASEDEEDSVMTALLAALRRLFKERNMTENDGFLSTDEILKKLNADKEAPWAGWRQGNGISAERLASFLRRFGIRSSQKRLKQDQTELDKFELRQEDEEKSSRPRGYSLKSLLPIFERYLSPLRSNDQT
jgi:putative DNA primase/helicase